MHDPFFSPAVLVMLLWMLARLVARRESRLAHYVPYAAMLFLFANFVYAGAGFAWRYTGDFWPFVVVAVVQYVQTERPSNLRPLDTTLTHVFLWSGLVIYGRFLVPWEWTTRADTVAVGDSAAMAQAFRMSLETRDSMPTRLACGDDNWSSSVSAARVAPLEPIFKNPYHQGQGWLEGCSVGSITNVYLGVVPKKDDVYAIRFRSTVVAPPTLTVYVNGKLYAAHRDGDEYRAVVHIRYSGPDLSRRHGYHPVDPGRRPPGGHSGIHRTRLTPFEAG